MAIEPEDIIMDIRSVSYIVGDTPTTDQYREYGLYHVYSIKSIFGSWNEALDIAGLDVNIRQPISGPTLNVEFVVDNGPSLLYDLPSRKISIDDRINGLDTFGIDFKPNLESVAYMMDSHGAEDFIDVFYYGNEDIINSYEDKFRGKIHMIDTEYKMRFEKLMREESSPEDKGLPVSGNDGVVV